MAVVASVGMARHVLNSRKVSFRLQLQVCWALAVVTTGTCLASILTALNCQMFPLAAEEAAVGRTTGSFGPGTTSEGHGASGGASSNRSGVNQRLGSNSITSSTISSYGTGSSSVLGISSISLTATAVTAAALPSAAASASATAALAPSPSAAPAAAPASTAAEQEYRHRTADVTSLPSMQLKLEACQRRLDG